MMKPTKRPGAKPRLDAGKRDAPKMQVGGDVAAPRMDRPGYKRGGAVKGKGTTVNVVIAPQGGAGGSGPGPAMPMPIRGPMPPPGPPPGAGGPPMGPPPGLAGAPIGPGGPGGPPMKRGGRLMAGAGSGMGRLQKNGR